MITACTSSAARCYEEQGDVPQLLDDVERGTTIAITRNTSAYCIGKCLSCCNRIGSYCIPPRTTSTTFVGCITSSTTGTTTTPNFHFNRSYSCWNIPSCTSA